MLALISWLIIIHVAFSKLTFNDSFIQMYVRSLAWHVVSFCWGGYLTLGYLNPEAWWQNIPQTMTFSEYMFLNASLSYCIYDLLTVQKKRKDVSMFIGHHIITTILIASAYILGFVQISIIILALFDVSDIFRPAARICNLLAKRGNMVFEKYAIFLFVLFALTWICTRNIFFVYIMYQVWLPKDTATCSEQGCPLGFESAFMLKEAVQMPFIYILMSLHGLLLIWSYKLVNACIKIFYGKKITHIKD